MIERKLYTCEYCHTDYIYKVNAEKCEANHLKNLTVIDKPYIVTGKQIGRAHV